MSIQNRKIAKFLCLALPLLGILLSSSVAPADNGAPAIEHRVPQAPLIELGVSGGSADDISGAFCTGGTLGALVQSGGVVFILSNNHVLARINEGIIGEDIIQPGLIDVGCNSANSLVVADLSAFIPLLFKSKGNFPQNFVDAAIAEIVPGAVIADGLVLDIGPVSGNTIPATLSLVGQSVQKSGRTTGYTVGIVDSVGVTINVDYGKGRVARFYNQIIITGSGFLDSGDSGSVAFENGTSDPGDGLPRAVGLLFAGSASTAIANPIDTVLGSFGASMVGGTPVAPGPTGSISGSVVRASDSLPLEGADVIVDTGQSATTDAFGAYLIANVPVGSREVTASVAGFDSLLHSADVLEATTTAVDFALVEALAPTGAIVNCVIYTTTGGKNSDKHMSISVSVVNDLGAPVVGAEVQIDVDRDGATFGSGTGAITDSSGVASYTIKNAANGVYETTVTNVISALPFTPSATPDHGNSFNKGADASPASFCLDSSSSSAIAGVPFAVAAASARQIKTRNETALLAIPGVVGVGLSLSAEGRPVIEVYLENGSARASIPASIEGVRVHSQVTGRMRAF